MDSQDVEKAKIAAYRLLKYRSRSEKELAKRLKRKKFSRPVINKVIVYLKRLSLVNDEEFTREWIQQRLNKGYWFIRIRRELKAKGISDKLINKYILRFKDKTESGSVIRQLARRRIRRYTDRPESEIKRKVGAYLCRRGFAVQDVYWSLDDIDYENS